MANDRRKQCQFAAFVAGVTVEQFHQVYWDCYPQCSSWQAARKSFEQRFPGGAGVAVFLSISIQIAEYHHRLLAGSITCGAPSYASRTPAAPPHWFPPVARPRTPATTFRSFPHWHLC